MTEKEITEGNKLIGEFMGMNIIQTEYDTFFKKEGKCSIHDWDFHTETVIYHKSWDWLMPVVEKIEENGWDVDIWSVKECKGCTISSQEPFLDAESERKNLFKETNSRIEATWLAVVEFIAYYNKQGK